MQRIIKSMEAKYLHPSLELVEDVFTKLDLGYYDWMMKSDFAENTKQVITKLYIQYKKK